MGGYQRRFDKKQSAFDIDIVKVEQIQRIIEEGENPLQYQIYYRNEQSRISYLDVFTYYRYYNKQFSIIISGGSRKNEQLRKRNSQEYSESSNKATKTKALRHK